jgi:hypothetical protein
MLSCKMYHLVYVYQVTVLPAATEAPSWATTTNRRHSLTFGFLHAATCLPSCY